MDDLFLLVFFIIFIVGPILERVLKGGKRPPQQRPPLPGQRPLPGPRPLPGQLPQRLPRAQLPESANAPTPSRAENAVDVLPADLWEMLTGQRPARGGPVGTGPAPRAPEPAPREAVEAEPFEAELEELEVSRPVPAPRDERTEVEGLMRRREREMIEARSVRHDEPTVVSLEATLLPGPRRHKAFHQRIEAAAALQMDVTRSDLPAFRIDEMGRSELQRAVLLQEILGPPKGLE